MSSVDLEKPTTSPPDLPPKQLPPNQSPTEPPPLEDPELCSYNNAPFYAMQGRIGRIRYLAYGMLLSLLVMIPLLILAALFGEPLLMMFVGYGNDVELGTTLLLILFFLIYCAASLFITFVPAIRRLHDTNQSGWLSLLLFIPLINFLVYLYLVFAPGDKGLNKYGAPAPPPTIPLYILGLIGPIALSIFVMIAFLAAPDTISLDDTDFNEQIILPDIQ